MHPAFRTDLCWTLDRDHGATDGQIMTTLSASITRVPIAVNTDRAASALEAVQAGSGTQWHDLLYALLYFCFGLEGCAG